MGVLTNKINKYLIMILVFLSSCSIEDNENVVYPNIEFVFEEKGICTNNAVTDPDILLSFSYRADTIITDTSMVNSYIKYINNLKDCDDCPPIDIRVVSVIHYSDHEQKVVCFGENCGTMVDGRCKYDNEELFSYINNLLYDEKGWEKLIIRSFNMQDRGNMINTKEFQEEKARTMNRVREYGYMYPKPNERKEKE